MSDTLQLRPDATEALTAALQQRILVIDGAMGTMVQRHKLEEEHYRGTRFADWPTDVKGNNDLLVLTQPDIIRDIHLAYLEAGADIVETDTFNAQQVSLTDYGMQELAYEFADVLAWLATIANVAKVDLQQAVLDKYGKGCPGCGQMVCTCGTEEKP